MTRLATIGITMGDPAGIGPEVICKALVEMSAEERAATVVFGTHSVLERASTLTEGQLRFASASASVKHGSVRVANSELPRGEVAEGKMSAQGGAAAYAYIFDAVQSALRRDIAAIVTAPINKEALHAAGYLYDGHTELLAHLTGARSSFMLLASEKLSTIHVTTHVSMAGAIQRITTERELATIRMGHAHCQRIGIAKPRIAVAGLNPHSGESGLFGRDEIERINPAIAQARAEGIEVSGPVPADTVFYRALNGEFDLVVAQYHDQGHIPTKLVAFDTTVNVSLGLPILRASVDHGTAFDIAWKGVARHDNMKAAIVYARRMTRGMNADAHVGGTGNTLSLG